MKRIKKRLWCDCSRPATITSTADGNLVCQECYQKELARKHEDKRNGGSKLARGMEPYHVHLVMA